jgi:hypothetical protein
MIAPSVKNGYEKGISVVDPGHALLGRILLPPGYQPASPD